MRELPPGQVETRRFPVVGECVPVPALTQGNWRLTVAGEVDAPLELAYRDVLAMPQRDLATDVHCVTGWSRPDTTFTGVPLADLLERVKPRPGARFVQFVAYSERDHDTSLPLDVARRDCWLAHSVEGAPLTAEHGGPLRIVTCGRYFYKSLKWARSILLLRDDAPGYWERESAYHSNADPAREERYDEARLAAPEEVLRFRELEDFSGYRRGVPAEVLIRANLANWSPRTKDLRGLRLKACDFDGADLRGADFRGANLTLSKFFRADLSGADFTGADLEGADFAGAVLTEARFVDVWLSAARFFRLRQNGSVLGPKDTRGMILRGARGLLEEQEQFLRDRGIVDSR